MFPVSRTTVSTLFATSADPPAPGPAHTPDRRRPCLLAGLTNDGVDLVRHLSRPPCLRPGPHSRPTAALLARRSHERRCRPCSPPQQTPPRPAWVTLQTDGGPACSPVSRTTVSTLFA